MSSLYIHIPFCDHICAYCDFSKMMNNSKIVNQYLDALEYEITDKKLNELYDTIYIGGGTPSSLTLQQLTRLFELIRPFSSKVKEYSIEVNPESMNEDKIDLMIKYGINRISIGVQSFNDTILKSINRYHSSKQAIELISLLKDKGIKDINVDLMYGLPNQKLEDVINDILMVEKLDISHISIYSLILEDHTLLKAKDFKPLDDEEDSYWYDTINTKLSEIGFKHYEVSNYYKDKPSLHNLVYWHYEDYEGIGLSAHSLIKPYRYENTNNLHQYLNHNYLNEKVHLSLEDQLFEMIMMGLRLNEGIDYLKINSLFNIDFINQYQNIIDKYVKLNMLELDNQYIKTTDLGMKYLNNILVEFLN